MARSDGPHITKVSEGNAMKFVILIALGIVLLSVVVLILSAHLPFTNGWLSPRPIPTSAQHIPVFPTASQVHEDYTSTVNVKFVSFQTFATAQDVQDYYKGILSNEGWESNKDKVLPTPDSLSFSYLDQAYESGFSFDLIIRQLDNGLIDVQIKLVTNTPY